MENSRYKDAAIFGRYFRAGFETLLLLAILGPVLYFPFLAEYPMSGSMHLIAGVAIASIPVAGLILGIYVPALAMMNRFGFYPSARELASILMVLAFFCELAAWLVMKGVVAPGIHGKMLLFGIFMSTFLSAWVFAFRHGQISKTPNK